MNLFRLILLFFIFTSPLKANAIYNLIKIPNLEIYDLKTSNKLKYFHSLKPFRLGIQKNIKCLNPDKELLDLKYKIIRCLCGIHDKWSKLFLLEEIKTNSGGLRLEAIRSMVLLNIDIPKSIQNDFSKEMIKLQHSLKKKLKKKH